MKKYKIRKPGGFAALFLLAASLMFVPVLSACKQTVDGGTSASKEKPSVPKVKLTLKKGNHIQNIQPQVLSVDKGSKWNNIKANTKITVIYEKGYKTDGWKLSSDYGEVLDGEYIFNEDTTIYAAAQAVPPPASGGQSVTITIRGDKRIAKVPQSNDTFIQKIEIASGEKWQNIRPTIEEGISFNYLWKIDRNNYGIYRWHLNDENGQLLNDDDVFDEDTTVYAVTNYTKWKIEDTKLTGYTGTGIKPRGRVFIPGNITEIGNKAFSECNGLEQVILPETVHTIGEQAFYRCTYLNMINMPDSLQTIGMEAFRACGLLSGALQLPPNLKTIGKRAFNGCSKLEKVTFPQSLTRMDKYAFGNCSDMTEADLSACTNIKSNDAWFGNCKKLTKVKFPANLQEIGNDTFSYCESLIQVTLPDGLQTIGESAFENCAALPKVTLPQTVKEIKDSAFYKCGSLKEVVFSRDLEKIGAEAFKECSKAERFDFVQCVRLSDIEHSAFDSTGTAEFKVKKGSGVKELLSKILRKTDIDKIVEEP